MIVLLTFTPAVAYFPFVSRVWLILSIGLLASFIATPNFYQTKRFYIFALYALLIFVNVSSGDEYFNNNSFVGELGYLLLPILMFQYCITGRKGDTFQNWVLLIMLIILTIETISTLVLDIESPGVVRNSFREASFSRNASIGESRKTYLIQYYRMGMTNYWFPHAVPILIPSTIYGIKISKNNTKINVILWWLVLIEILLLCWLSGSTTALMLAVVFTIIGFLTKEASPKRNVAMFIIVSLVVLPFMLVDNLTLWLLDILGDLVSNNVYFSSKVDIFRESILYGDTTGDLAVREDKYSISINQFLSNIILGTNGTVGNHSTFLDRLAVLGLVGFIPYVLLFFMQFKYSIKTIPNDCRIFYFESFFAGIIMLLLKDVDNWETFLILFTILPIQLRVIRQKAFVNI